MSEFSVVVHPGCIDSTLDNPNISVERRNLALIAQDRVGRLLNNSDVIQLTDSASIDVRNKKVIVLNDDLNIIRRFFYKDDRVQMYGAYGDICVREVGKIIMNTGAKVKFDMSGIIMSDIYYFRLLEEKNNILDKYGQDWLNDVRKLIEI